MDVGRHAMFPDATHDEQALQNFIKDLRVFVSGRFHRANKVILARKLDAPASVSDEEPLSRRHLRALIGPEPQHRWYSAMMRTTQEMLYDTVGPSITRQLPDLIARAKAMDGAGSLELDPEVAVPRYLSSVDNHCKPGSYLQELAADDVFAGAEFDRTYRLYSMGAYGPLLDGLGWTLIEWLRAAYPALAPRDILDMGCTVGHSTLPYTEAFGEGVNVHAIDVAAPCLRYGHARAVALGRAVHFHQQNAERTRFPDCSFDLVVSHALMHETSRPALRAIVAESHRLLRPGGVMAHIDGIDRTDGYDKFYSDWMARYNNEPFLGTVQDEAFESICAQAGFEPSRTRIEPVQGQRRDRGDGAAQPVFTYLVVAARKGAVTDASGSR